MEAVASNEKNSGLILPFFVLDLNITSGAKLMYALLNDYASKYEHVWPSQKTLAAKLSCSVSSVKKYLAELAKAKLISIRLEQHRSSYHYILPTADQAEAKVGPKPETAPVRSNAGYGELQSDHAQPEIGYLDKTKNQEKIQIPPLPPVAAAQRTSPANRTARVGGASFSDFEKLCEAYPKKQAMGLARHAWSQLLRSGQLPPLSELLAAINRFITTENWQRENGRFIPQLSNWLRGQRWLDPLSPEEEQAAQQRLEAQAAELARKQEMEAHEYRQKAERERLRPTFQAFKAKFTKEQSNGPDSMHFGKWLSIHSKYGGPTAADVPGNNTLNILDFMEVYQRKRGEQAYRATQAAHASLSGNREKTPMNCAEVLRGNGIVSWLLPPPQPLCAAV